MILAQTESELDVIAEQLAECTGGQSSPALECIGKAGSIREIERGRNTINAQMLFDQIIDGVMETYLIAQFCEADILLLQPPL